jgi:cob(I)alamin adenosyltransferase
VIVAIAAAIGAIKAEASDIRYVFSIPHQYIRNIATDVVEAHARKDEEIARKTELAQAEVQRAVAHVRRDLADGKREAAQNDLFKAQLEMKKATDDATRQFIQEQVTRLQQTKDKLDRQIESLNKASGQE